MQYGCTQKRHEGSGEPPRAGGLACRRRPSCTPGRPARGSRRRRGPLLVLEHFADVDHYFPHTLMGRSYSAAIGIFFWAKIFQGYEIECIRHSQGHSRRIGDLMGCVPSRHEGIEDLADLVTQFQDARICVWQSCRSNFVQEPVFSGGASGSGSSWGRRGDNVRLACSRCRIAELRAVRVSPSHRSRRGQYCCRSKNPCTYCVIPRRPN
ncbi:MAG: hypothetical protein QG671_1466 [Actinomycetota bacterium]|nr:hypothetical protein [Actinomycetota bacterium]